MIVYIVVYHYYYHYYYFYLIADYYVDLKIRPIKLLLLKFKKFLNV